MALVVKDRVQEQTLTVGTISVVLTGAVTGFQTFSSAIGNGNTTYYTIQGDSEWEVGIGTVGVGTLSRDTVLESSNAGSLVNFSVGTKNVFCTYPAEKSVDIETSQTLTNKSMSGASNTFTNIPNSALTNSSITINGAATSLGGSISVGTVTSVTGTSPIASSGGTTPAISISQATTSTNGYLSSTDWNTFNNKGSGTVTSVGGTGTVNGITLTGTVTSSGSLTLGGTLSGVSLSSQVTGTLPIANGGTGVTAKPSFSAYNSSSTTLTNGGWAKIAFQTEEWDTNSNYDNSTNYRFTPSVAGYYQVEMSFYTPNNCICRAGIYKNGSLFKAGQIMNNTYDRGQSVSCLVYLNGSTDYIEGYAYNTGTANSTTTGAENTWFQATFVR